MTSIAYLGYMTVTILGIKTMVDSICYPKLINNKDFQVSRQRMLLICLGFLVTFFNLSYATTSIYGYDPLYGQGDAVPLNILWRVALGSTDKVTTANPTERDSYPLDGAIAYVPRDATWVSTLPMYRLYNGVDHMDSMFAGEGGYTTEGVLGYLWTSNLYNGIYPIKRSYQSSDHATITYLSALPSYTEEGVLGYGYPRYLNTKESLSSISAGGVTIKSNYVAGGALWSWVWNNTEFISIFDHGRQIQSSLTPGYSPTPYTTGDGSNPTEAGDDHGYSHGSPCARLDNYTTSTTEFPNASSISPVQATRAVPLEWQPSVWTGGGDNPVVWRDLLMGKNITLNYSPDGIDRNWPVAKYTTVLWSKNSISSVFVEIPTGYLRGNFDRFYTYDASSQVLAEVTFNVTETGTGYMPASGYGGVIITTSDNTLAMAVYGVSTANGGSIKPTTNGINGFGLFRFPAPDGTAPASYNCSKWAAYWYGATSSGETLFNVYVMTGSLSDCQNYMRTLYGFDTNSTLISVTSSSPAKVVWSDVTGETGYTIERKTGSGGTYVQVGATAANVTTFWDTSVASGTTYTYRLKPSNALYSNERSVTTPTFSTLVNENFNATSTGSLPGGWIKTTTTNTTVSVQAYPSVSNKSIKLYDNSTSGLCTVEKNFTSASDWLFASFSFNASGDGATFQLKSGSTVAVDLLLKNGNLVYRNASGAETTIMACAFNTWYTLKVVPSVSLKTFDLYVDGVLKVKGGAFRNTALSNIDRISFGSDSALKNTTYIDDIFIQK
jgi:hypothetical protein